MIKATVETERIRALVAELDAAVPREEARVRLEQYGGGPDETYVLATPTGALRLGIEFLRAAVEANARADAESSRGASIELEYLLDPNSSVSFDWIEVREEFESAPRERTFRERATEFAIAGGVLLVLVLLILGAVTVLRWII